MTIIDLAQARQQRKSKRGRKPAPKTRDTLSVRLNPQTIGEIESWARRIGVNRSELGRWGWEEILKLIRRRGRHQIRNSIDKRRAASRPDTSEEDAYFASLPRFEEVQEE